MTAVISNSGLIWPKRTFANIIDHRLRQMSSVQAVPPPAKVLPATVQAEVRPKPQTHPKPSDKPGLAGPASYTAEAVPSAQYVVVSPHRTPPAIPISRPAPKLDLAMELPTAIRLSAVDFQRRQQLLVSQINRTLKPGCHVLAWNTLPLDLFQGELGRFLVIACDFHAYGPGNTLLLPAMPAGCQELSLPRHPLVASNEYKAEAQRRIALLRTKVSDGHKRASIALQQGDMTQLFNRTEQQQSYRQELIDITTSLTTSMFGKIALASHEEQFRAKIKAM